jgi:hypothetical protein
VGPYHSDSGNLSPAVPSSGSSPSSSLTGTILGRQAVHPTSDLSAPHPSLGSLAPSPGSPSHMTPSPLPLPPQIQSTAGLAHRASPLSFALIHSMSTGLSPALPPQPSWSAGPVLPRQVPPPADRPQSAPLLAALAAPNQAVLSAPVGAHLSDADILSHPTIAGLLRSALAQMRQSILDELQLTRPGEIMHRLLHLLYC